MILKGRPLKTSSLLKISYLIILGTAILYVKSVLHVDSFQAVEKSVDKSTPKVEEVSVTLIARTASGDKVYEAKMQSNNSVEDLLKELRDKQGLYYEKDLYTYGTSIVSVFAKVPADGEKWAILDGDKDITNAISSTYLTNKANYTLTLLVP